MHTAAVSHELTIVPAQRRNSHRRDSEGQATIRIATSDDPTLVNHSLRCNVLDISENGLRLETSAMIPGDSKLVLWVSLDNVPRRFFLKGEVRWVSFEENGEFNVGVELVSEKATEFASWTKLVSAPVLKDIVCLG